MPARKDYRRPRNPQSAASIYGPAASRRVGTRKAAIYLRLSRDTDATTSPERQLAACMAKAVERGYDVPEDLIFSDIDVSAYSRALDDREGLTRLRARWCEIDALIVFKLDRLIRNVRDFVDLTDEAERYGSVILSATEGAVDTEGFGKALSQVLAIFAEMESGANSIRTTSSIAYLRKIGRWKGGTRPFGYMPAANPDGPGKVLVIQPEEAELVRELAQRIVAGDSLRSIALDWTARGIRTRHGAKAWTFRVLWQIARNPVHVGQQVHHGEVMRGDDGMPLTPHPAILDLTTWQAVAAELDSRTIGWTPRPRVRLFQGVLTCRNCGRALHSGGMPTPERRTYRCAAKGNGGTCPGVYLNARHVEPYLSDRFLDRVGGAPYVERVERPAPESLAPQIQAVQEAMDGLLQLRFDPDRPFTGEVGDTLFHKQATALQARLDALLAEQATLPQGGVEWAPTGRTIRQEWDARDESGRRDLLAAFYVNVAVGRGTKGSHRFNPARLTITTAEDMGLDPVQTVIEGKPLRAPLPGHAKSRRPNAFVTVDPARTAATGVTDAPDKPGAAA